MPTRRLYHDDAYLRRFDADGPRAHDATRISPRSSSIATAFYPEAGGQLGDRGTLGGAGGQRHAGARRRHDRPRGRAASSRGRRARDRRARLGAPPPAHGAAHRAAPAVGRAARSRAGADGIGAARRERVDDRRRARSHPRGRARGGRGARERHHRRRSRDPRVVPDGGRARADQAAPRSEGHRRYPRRRDRRLRLLAVRRHALRADLAARQRCGSPARSATRA